MSGARCQFMACVRDRTDSLLIKDQDGLRAPTVTLCAEHRSLIIDANERGLWIGVTTAGTVWINTIADFWFWRRVS